MIAGEVLGALCKRCGPEVYQSVYELIHDGVKNNLERIPMSDRSQGERESATTLMEKLAVQHERVRPQSRIVNRPESLPFFKAKSITRTTSLCPHWHPFTPGWREANTV